MFVYEKTFRSVVQKKHFSIFRSVVRKKHFSIFRSIVQKKHSNILLIQKKSIILFSFVISENSAFFNLAVQDNLFSSRLKFVTFVVEKKNISNCITHAIQKNYQSKLKYRNFAFRRSFIEKRTRQALRFFIHFDVVELKTRDFDRVARFENFELFNFIIIQIDVFFEHVSFRNNLVSQSFFDLRIKLKNFYSYTKNQFRNYHQNYRFVLYKMKKKNHLVIIDISKNLKIYRRSKNVDSTIFLFVRYHEHLHVFFKQKADMLFQHELHDHVIHLKKDAQFFNSALYDMNHNEITKLRRYLNENLNKKFIRVNRFETAVLVLFVKKFDENLRFCVNYKDLNAVIVKNRYFLFLIFEIFNRFNRVKIFIKLDIIVAFNRIRIRKKNEFLIVFRTRFELFEYLIMLFDLCNESISFQNYINDIFREYLDDFCIAYFDVKAIQTWLTSKELTCQAGAWQKARHCLPSRFPCLAS